MRSTCKPSDNDIDPPKYTDRLIAATAALGREPKYSASSTALATTVSGLLRKPIHSDPLADCSGRHVAFVGEIVKAKRATARQIEVVKHLVHFHGAPLTRGL